ncbi:hypothetical protein GJH25_09405 [Staphylococcus aureus]|nr:hypothetical protein [Staphylococcus aureus]MRL82826.1 hypothetical protein [Staphylococcus aureus]MRM15738.1 hypothetical protein [Staphylococcus aureus]MRM21119.1 hypothetical protein [Staphylococcus aureus]MRM31482.1 hypothetical protein [Staphylococcus aureus]
MASKHVCFYAENRLKHLESERCKKYIGYFSVMKGVSRHVFVRIVQAIIMKRLVYCFKLDNDEFNLKNKYKKYKPCVTRVSDDLNTIYRYISNNKIIN